MTVLNFDNSYQRLPERFYSRQSPAVVAAPALVCLNTRLADELGLDPDFFNSPAALAMFCGNSLPAGAQPIAMAYAGHQFGGWVPQLGDGRAILLGEIVDPQGRRQDLQLKGAGRTPYSRGGDGRAWLGPVLREYIVSEAMAAFGIPTTRALAAVTTGETVRRESALPGAILTRVAASHVRVGTFEFFSARQDKEALQTLADYIIARHYPQLAEQPNPPAALLRAVLERQASLVARWQGIGFIHGVMNTDNMSITGDTIDYGPCAFIDDYHPARVFSSIDMHGRYAYQNQPRIAQWNLAVLAQTLLPLIDQQPERAVEQAQQIIDSFPQIYQAQYLATMRDKLGLAGEEPDDLELVVELLQKMADHQADFTNTFRTLTDCAQSGAAAAAERPGAAFLLSDDLQAWRQRWQQRQGADAAGGQSSLQRMRQANPVYIPRNHQIERVIQSALNQDYQPLHKLLAVLENPFSEHSGAGDYALPPTPDQVVQQTFCGT